MYSCIVHVLKFAPESRRSDVLPSEPSRGLHPTGSREVGIELGSNPATLQQPNLVRRRRRTQVAWQPALRDDVTTVHTGHVQVLAR